MLVACAGWWMVAEGKAGDREVTRAKAKQDEGKFC